MINRAKRFFEIASRTKGHCGHCMDMFYDTSGVCICLININETPVFDEKTLVFDAVIYHV